MVVSPHIGNMDFEPGEIFGGLSGGEQSRRSVSGTRNAHSRRQGKGAAFGAADLAQYSGLASTVLL